MQEHIETAAVAVPVILAAVSQLAALFGKPGIVEKIGVLSKLFDLFAGNYGKARNAPKW